ncbi:Glycerol-3-phosphate dehydrogenase (NAD(P)+) [Nitrospina gracilis 3/211]|uniref:Glycerol-3-phosphate dehydrogenase [NAD(P)+] n=1 Tax=Nitrospina gracilis (strain 3/211) TaxID=1266370 RepID=M1YLY7_NITG3|nr:MULTISPECIES: NAD(P)H-dependent glycerol-3-phosphate dehydrogenase [Nitrospina]MCF8724349.1 glycerol-3-phosphate dehydrogenase (NAD(P)+) [Nitrospina sp. Nb-3]CCQ91501.1 Glycerol-3-phosphate dehydrogenase (NAD(P)+) [Nitrospina gracilis 3/211]
MTDSSRIGVVGAGSWGTALSLLLAEQGREVDLWTFEPEVCAAIKEKRENTFFLPGMALPDSIHPSTRFEDVVMDKDEIVLVVPTHVLRSTVGRFAPLLKPDSLVISASKGIENDSLEFVHQIVNETLGRPQPFAALSGPTFASEIAGKTPSAIVAAAENEEIAARVKALFESPFLKVFTSNDVLGVELGGALKNVIAIATGISDGLGLGLNTRAALINRGLVEMTRIGTALGARPETFSGLSGMGDLVLTCTGDLSRNRTVGLKLAKGESLDQITGSMKMVAEGVHTVISAYRLKENLNIQAAIIEETYQVLHRGKSPQSALLDLMNVDIGSEFSGIKGL